MKQDNTRPIVALVLLLMATMLTVLLTVAQQGRIERNQSPAGGRTIQLDQPK